MKLLIPSRKIVRSILLLWALSTGMEYTPAQTIHTFAGGIISGGYSGDGGTAAAARLDNPASVAIDGSGNVYIADLGNNRIRKVNTSGIICTIAGNGVAGFSGDGGAATAAEMDAPDGIAIDGAGNVYFSDQGNECVRKVNTSGIISTIAGNGTFGYSGDGIAATAAELHLPCGVAVDASGNVYIADLGNYRIRKVNTSGIISTFAGNGSIGYTGDGGAATAAAIGGPRYLVFDGAGDLYFSDYANNVVRKISSAGIISTVAGNGISGYSGDGGAATVAELNWPMGIALDAAGNIYVGEYRGERIRKITPSGMISTYAGYGGLGFAGDGGPATDAMFDNIDDIATDGSGNVYIVDGSNRVRIVTHAPMPVFDGGSAQSLIVCESTGANAINSLLAVTDPGTGLTETYSVAAAAAHGAITAGGIVTSGTSVTPTGWAYTPSIGYTGTDTFTIQVSNDSNTSGTTIYVTVNPLPVPVAGAITGTHSICPGSIDTLADTSSGGTWSSAIIGIATVSGSLGLTVAVTGIAAGTDTIYYSVTNSCGIAAVYAVVTVNPLSNPGTITGSAAVCVGASATLIDPAPGGVWSSGTTGMATVSSTTGFTTAVSGIAAGTDVIYYTVTTGCGTAVAAYTVNVLDVPVVIAIAGPDTVCLASSSTLTDATTGGTWTSSSPSLATIGAATGVVTPAATGADSIVYAVTNGCGTTRVVHLLVIDSLPSVAAVTGPTVVCKDSTMLFMDGTPGGIWSTSPHASIGAASGLLTASAVGPDTVFYTVTNLCGPSRQSYLISVLNCDTTHSNVGVANMQDIVPGLYITPNPSDGHFTLRLAYPARETSRITITDMYGKRLQSFDLPTNTEQQVKLTLPAGIYIVSGMIRSETFAARLVIE